MTGRSQLTLSATDVRRKQRLVALLPPITRAVMQQVARECPLTRDQLVVRAGLTRKTLDSLYTRGRTPSLVTLMAYCFAAGQKPSEVMARIENILSGVEQRLTLGASRDTGGTDNGGHRAEQ